MLEKGIELEVDDKDIKDLIQEHNEELLTSKLKELETMQHSAVQEEISEETKNRKANKKIKTEKLNQKSTF